MFVFRAIPSYKARPSQEVFAQYMGVSVKTVEAWEAGRNHPEGAACRLLAMTKADPQFPIKAGIVSQ